MASRRTARVGTRTLGGGAPVALQSMTATDPHDADATIAQAVALAEAGCDIVRIAVPDLEAVAVARQVRQRLGPVPLVADVHFDHRVAVAVAPHVDKIRLNPGTIRGRDALGAVAAALRDHGTALRIGANSGSLPAELRDGPAPMAERLCDAVAPWVARFEDAGVRDLVVSVKATSPLDTLAACRLAAARFDHPLHVGLTESGTPRTGAVRSAVVIGALLAGGIGDTIRVSLAGDPLEEIRVGLEILRSLGMRPEAGRVIACPTCGRATMDVAAVAQAIEVRMEALRVQRTVAVMGCVVNGPGEARMADLAIVGTADGAAFYRQGKVAARGSVQDAVEALLAALSDAPGQACGSTQDAAGDRPSPSRPPKPRTRRITRS
jgi:(E)-4-hydroxy-3-methylbut-2-enyl-diphosphate synthase